MTTEINLKVVEKVSENNTPVTKNRLGKVKQECDEGLKIEI